MKASIVFTLSFAALVSMLIVGCAKREEPAPNTGVHAAVQATEQDINGVVCYTWNGQLACVKVR